MHKRSPLLWSLQCVADAMASENWAEAIVPVVRSGLRGIDDKEFALALYASAGPGAPFEIQADLSRDLPLSVVPEIPRGGGLMTLVCTSGLFPSRSSRSNFRLLSPSIPSTFPKTLMKPGL